MEKSTILEHIDKEIANLIAKKEETEKIDWNDFESKLQALSVDPVKFIQIPDKEPGNGYYDVRLIEPSEHGWDQWSVKIKVGYSKSGKPGYYCGGVWKLYLGNVVHLLNHKELQLNCARFLSPAGKTKINNLIKTLEYIKKLGTELVKEFGCVPDPYDQRYNEINWNEIDQKLGKFISIQNMCKERNVK